LSTWSTMAVWAETLHPNVCLFLYDIEDAAFGMRCAQIYKRLRVRAVQQQRLIPNAVVTVRRRVALAVGERSSAAGRRASAASSCRSTRGREAVLPLGLRPESGRRQCSRVLLSRSNAGSGSGIDFVKPLGAGPLRRHRHHRAASR